MKEQMYNGYTLSCKRRRFKVKQVMRLLSLTYWAKGRDQATVRRCLRHATPFGVFTPDGTLVAFMRITSDRATMFYLADVIVAEEERGKGLALAMLRYALSHEKLCRGKGMLLTQTANGLYEKLGFYNMAERLMVRDPVQKNAGAAVAPGDTPAAVDAPAAAK